jgi:hypothetical protein
VPRERALLRIVAGQQEAVDARSRHAGADRVPIVTRIWREYQMTRATCRVRFLSRPGQSCGTGPRPSHRKHGSPRRARGRRSRVGGIHLRRRRRWHFLASPDGVPAEPSGVSATMVPVVADVNARPTPPVVATMSTALSAAPTSSELAAHKAVRLWLRWNDAYEKVSACLYAAGPDPRRVEELSDELDQLRRQAIRLSRQATNGIGE